ncbi:MAG: anhydro-N-acetylmuramic acid kinase [Gammaproteobacteria bacterium]|nr:anhydro-N-acetylmuramic acid kinase [Gammaproteobacteria bacterium]
MTELYIGLISGTSVDGVDAVLCEIDDAHLRVLAAETLPYPPELRKRVVDLIDRPEISLAELGSLDVALGEHFAACALGIASRAGIAPSRIAAIGHHGQTVFHKPAPPEPFSLQLGDPNVVAARTGITTVADLRRLDIALGGQGAPLVPAFHAWRFADPSETRVVVNIGGIANVTVLAPGRDVLGFDTGPGNTLLDRWIERARGLPRDERGEWAAGGRVDRDLLAALLEEPYFEAPPPKSTGREHFNIAWLDARLAAIGARPDDRDVQATLAELTAETIASAVARHAPGCARLIVCGGGAHNTDLLRRLERTARVPVETTERYGIGPDWVEGAAFAWLARARLEGRPGNLPSVTGARRPALLGGVYSP